VTFFKPGMMLSTQLIGCGVGERVTKGGIKDELLEKVVHEKKDVIYKSYLTACRQVRHLSLEGMNNLLSTLVE
jgi:hypothetical protein